MVTVPSYQRSVADRPAFQQGITARATPEDMGAAIGRGIQAVGQGVGQAGAAFGRLQEIEDTTRAKEADNALAEWSRNAMYGEAGFMTLEGKAAVDARANFEKAWEEQRKLFGAGLTPGAAKSYQSASTARRNQVLESTIVHTANERKSWVKAASASRVNTFGEDALAGFDNPKRVDFNISAGQAELRQQAELEGWDADTLANNEMEFVSGVRKNIALRMAIDDPLAAQAYVEQFSDQLTGPHQFDLANTLKAPVTDERAKSEAARILADPTADVEAELALIEDEDVRDLARTRISAAGTVQRAANEAAAKQLKQGAFEMIEKGGNPDLLTIEQKGSLGVEGMSQLWTYFEKKNSGEHLTVDDGEAVYGLTKRAAIDPEGFSKLDLNEYRDKLSPQNFKVLADKQAAIFGDMRKAKEDGLSLTAAFSQSNDALESVGISLTGKTGAEREAAGKRVAEFQNVLTGQLEEFKAANDGRNPDQSEIQAIVNRLLLPVVMKGPKDFFNWDGKKEDGFLFEAGSRGDNSTVEVSVNYRDIPMDVRRAIAADLESALGRKPSEAEVTTQYEVIALGL